MSDSSAARLEANQSILSDTALHKDLKHHEKWILGSMLGKSCLDLAGRLVPCP